MSTVFLSADSDRNLHEFFRRKGYNVHLIRTSGIVQEPVSCHPDMFMCRLGIDEGSPVFYCPDISEDLGIDIALDDSLLAAGSRSPGICYPFDIAYNAACTGRFFIHYLKYTDPALLNAARAASMQLVDVKQGYAKCSTVIVDSSSVITYDRGIARACEAAGMNVLTVSPGNVVLPGYDTGFLGGASGRVDDTVYFNGDLTAHPDFRMICDFIDSRGLRIRWFEDYPLTDIGSIIQVK